eukprot:9157124-Prorocentrum_lima.AAC.1
MTSSLVGSEMCIRDRVAGVSLANVGCGDESFSSLERREGVRVAGGDGSCLLYTSDAADDM